MQPARLPEVLVMAIIVYTLFLYIFYGISSSSHRSTSQPAMLEQTLRADCKSLVPKKINLFYILLTAFSRLRAYLMAASSARSSPIIAVLSAKALCW
ncbi:Uncharacterised protein [uncultured archaeon]|nr:Uncharacterised protein [uncultured archaeon]